MPDDTEEPEYHVHQVGPDERNLLKQARGIVRRAYWNSPTLLVIWVGSLALITAIRWAVDPNAVTIPHVVGLAVVLYLSAIVGVPLITTWSVRRQGHKMFLLTTSEAKAVVVVGPGRPGEPPTHRHVSALAASPKRRGAGGTLARHIRDRYHSEGLRLTATARPRLAKKYQEGPDGMVRHHSAERWWWPHWFLVKLISPPTPNR